MKVYKLTEFARMIGVSPQTLRNWDNSGKFVADKTPANQRVYSQAHLDAYRAGDFEKFRRPVGEK